MQCKHILFALLSAVAIGAPSNGRPPCAAPDPPAALIKQAQSFQASEAQGSFSAQAVIEVDLYFHVVSASTSVADGNVPQSQLDNQFTYMNKAYSSSGIHFNLKGTDRTVNANWANDGNEVAMKTALRKGTYASLNIYFLKTPMSGALGYCYFPANVAKGSTDYIKDGCVIIASSTPGGSLTGYNLGGTAVHESGHWFGLFHTFQGQSCTGAGDSISDTPQQLSPTSGCPSSRDSCPNAAGLDPIHNYMDYSTDVCYTQFTAGQNTRMSSMFNTYRAGK